MRDYDMSTTIAVPTTIETPEPFLYRHLTKIPSDFIRPASSTAILLNLPYLRTKDSHVPMTPRMVERLRNKDSALSFIRANSVSYGDHRYRVGIVHTAYGNGLTQKKIALVAGIIKSDPLAKMAEKGKGLYDLLLGHARKMTDELSILTNTQNWVKSELSFAGKDFAPLSKEQKICLEMCLQEYQLLEESTSLIYFNELRE